MVTLTVECFSTGSEGFAQSASYWEVSGSGSSALARVIFDDAGFANSVDGSMLEQQSPRVTVLTAEVPNVSRRSAIALNGVLYYIKRVSDDGTGVATLELSKDNVR